MITMASGCSSRYAVAHTFFPGSAEEKVTFHEPGVAPLDHITPSGFSVLDLALVPVDWLDGIRSITSNRFAALASHHFVDGFASVCNLPKDWARANR